MSRSISADARRAFYSQETEEAFLILLEIDNWEDPTTPIRVAYNNADVTSTLSGEYSSAKTFLGTFFHIELPDESGESANTVRLAIDNVDQRMVLAIRNLSDPPNVRLWIVSSRDTNTVEAGPLRFVLESVDYDRFYIRGELVFENVVNRRWPQHDFTPSNTPGIF